jgi:hypothetical protein
MAMPEDVSALHLVLTGDPALFAIVRLSLVVNLSAVMFAALIGVPFGALIAPTSFRGREIAIVVLNALMGLPPASRRGFEPGPNPDRDHGRAPMRPNRGLTQSHEVTASTLL